MGCPNPSATNCSVHGQYFINRVAMYRTGVVDVKVMSSTCKRRMPRGGTIALNASILRVVSVFHQSQSGNTTNLKSEYFYLFYRGAEPAKIWQSVDYATDIVHVCHVFRVKNYGCLLLSLFGFACQQWAVRLLCTMVRTVLLAMLDK